MHLLRLCTAQTAFFNDIAEIIRVFYPDATVAEGTQNSCDLLHTHSEDPGWTHDMFTDCASGKTFSWHAPLFGDELELKRCRKRAMKTCCYHLLKQLTGVRPPWGSLTGIRPTRLMAARLAAGESFADAELALRHRFDLSKSRTALLSQTLLTQSKLLPPQKDAVDLYVGIPFCPTRCAYCSFFAEAIGKGKKVPSYLNALLHEIEAMRELITEAGLKVRALYIGGGTPTSLDASSLSRLLEALSIAFPHPVEWTVEAGRPDTLDISRLSVLRDYPVSRISINPQTMNDETLRRIGRAHTSRQTEDAFALARKLGFDNINMDLIAALPGENADDFGYTLSRIRELDPESLTIHTLARKHGSALNEFGFEATDSTTAQHMVEAGALAAQEMGMVPYYLYRQKYAAGNLENVGYTKENRACLYNVDIMEETQSILALGAGGISKRVMDARLRIVRAPNVSEVEQYIRRVDEMIVRKRSLFLGNGYQ